MMNIQPMTTQPMFQYVAFGRDDVLNTLEFVRNATHRLEQQIVYAEEMGVGRRDDKDWEDVAARCREYFEDIRAGLQRFGTEVSFTPDNINRLTNIKIKPPRVDDDDDLPF